MNEYVPAESTTVTVGVFGEQGAGKTVFLTCIFQSIWTAFPDDVVLDFDRDEIGNADHFRDIEDLIISRGQPEGTLPEHLFPARIYVKPYRPLAGAAPPVLAVDIKDFAGVHFRSLANVKTLGTKSAFEGDDVKALREVNESINKSDAIVILINAKKIDPLNETPNSNPFTPSVNFLLTHCRNEKKPVALLFSQIDQTKMLTEEVFRTMPRVQAFERQFTSDPAIAAAEHKPFGIVRRISCYETVEGDLAPIRQTLDGSIWKPEPAQVVLQLLRAALPRINARLREAAEEALRKKREAKLADERKWKWKIIGAAAAVAGAFLITCLVLVWQAFATESRKLALLADVRTRIAEGKAAEISPEATEALGQILAAYRADRGGTSSAVRAAIHDVHSAFAEAAQRLADSPEFDERYSAELVRFQTLASLLDPENAAAWRPTVWPLLQARNAFLADWFRRSAKGDERLAVLSDAIQRFSTFDAQFARVLAAHSEKARPPRMSRSGPRPARRAPVIAAMLAAA